MNKRNNSQNVTLLQKSRTFSLVVLIGFVLLFLLMSHFIAEDPNLTNRVFPTIFQFVICALVVVLMGRIGFYYSAALNLVQITLYLYELFVFEYSSPPALIVFCLASVFVDFVVAFSINQLYSRYSSLKSMYNTLRSRNLTMAEDTKTVDVSMARTSLIVNHDEDISRSASNIVELTKNMSLDSLTTLPNREKILEHIDTLIDDSISYSQSKNSLDKPSDPPITVVYFSIDKFVEITRVFGHPIMDLFIQSTAHRIREAANPSDLVGRVSGSEFVVVLKRNLNDEEINEYVQTLRDAVSNSFRNENNEIFLTTSAGIAQYPKNTSFPGELLKLAEAAMCTASSANGNKIVHYEIEQTVHKESFLSYLASDDLRELFNKSITDGSIYMVYQPRFSSEKKLVGFEAFLRFEHPEYGHVRTVEFIESAERCGFIYTLGKFSFEKAFNTLKLINAIDPTLTMTINLSSVQLKSDVLLDDLKEMLDRCECVMQNLEFDISEESLISSFTPAKRVLSGIAEMGIKTSLDNFGRGYSSLNNIPLLPISCVKLDGNFTNNLKNDTAIRVLTASIISLLHEIDISVAATGVGGEEQFIILQKYHCDSFQGIYFNTPMSESDTVEFVKHQTFS